MSVKLHEVSLSPKERRTIRVMLRKGTHKARTLLRARILLCVHQGASDLSISTELGCALKTPRDVRKRYADGGIERALFDAPRPGQPATLTGKQQAKVVALACTDPPDGYGRWTLNLLQEAVVKNVKQASRMTVYRVLLANELKPWREKNVVYPEDRRRV